MRITHGSRDTFPCPANRCFWLSTYVLHASTTLSSRPLPTFPPCKRNLVFWKRTKSFPSQIVQIRFFNPSFFRFRFLERALVFFVSFLFFIARCIVQNRGRKRAGWVLLLPIPTRFVLSGDYFRSHAPVKYASNNAVVTRFYDFLLSQLCPTTTTALHVHTKLHLAAEIQACFLLFLREVRKSRCDRRNEGYTCPTIDPPFCYSKCVSTWSPRRPRKTYEPRKRGRERKGIHFYCRLPPKKVFARLASSEKRWPRKSQPARFIVP